MAGAPDHDRPPVAWVREHEAISPDQASPASWDSTEIPTPLRSVWLLDRNGLQPRDPQAFVWFWAVQMDKVWNQRASSSPGGLNHRRDPRWPGHAAFAELAGTDEFYLETMWGRQTCGRGDKVRVSPSGVVQRTAELWIE